VATERERETATAKRKRNGTPDVEKARTRQDRIDLEDREGRKKKERNTRKPQNADLEENATSCEQT
jgi:hypothetical protein